MAEEKGKKVLSPIFRVSFPSVFEPAKPMEGSEGKRLKYEATMVFRPGDFDAADKTRFNEMVEILDAACQKAFKKGYRELDGSYKKAFRKGEEKAHLSGFGEGTVFAKCSSFMKPGVYKQDGATKFLDSEQEKFYPGCYARATVTAYTYNKAGNKGVAFGLQNIMFVEDGDRLDSRTDGKEDFGEVAVASAPAADASIF